jgi:hypothetical protein
MVFYFYKTTNKINGKFYYGSGQKDGYFGSGRDLMRAIKKYGKENFITEKLKFFMSRKEAFEFEGRFLSLYKIKENKNSYNLTNYGNGGNRIDYEGDHSGKYRENSRISITSWNMSEISKKINRDRLLENNPMDDPISKNKAVKALENWKMENDHPMKGKTHTNESRKKISETRKERGIIPYNKGKKLERESLCEFCNNKFTKQGLKRHQPKCKK